MAWSSFWQSYHSLPSYTWFESILTQLWSSYLVWTILTNILIHFPSKRWLEVLFDNHIIHCHPTHGLSLLERFGKKYFVFIKWRLCKHCLKNKWTLAVKVRPYFINETFFDWFQTIFYVFVCAALLYNWKNILWKCKRPCETHRKYCLL